MGNGVGDLPQNLIALHVALEHSGSLGVLKSINEAITAQQASEGIEGTYGGVYATPPQLDPLPDLLKEGRSCQGCLVLNLCRVGQSRSCSPKSKMCSTAEPYWRVATKGQALIIASRVP